MNKVGGLLAELHDAETGLAAGWRAVGERQAAEHDVYYHSRMLAAQCEKHAEAVRAIAQRFEKNLSGSSGPQTPHNVMAGIRRKTSELLGHRPEPGLLLLHDLRQLYLMAEEVSIHWLALGQVAQAVPDHDLLDQVTALHKQTLTQIKWLKTRIRHACPQILLVPG
jgi:hypothetical protein